MGHDWSGYEKAGYMGEEIIKKIIWTSGRARPLPLPLYKHIDIVADIK